jgi:hypothetical protein
MYSMICRGSQGDASLRLIFPDIFAKKFFPKEVHVTADAFLGSPDEIQVHAYACVRVCVELTTRMYNFPGPGMKNARVLPPISVIQAHIT